MSNCILAALRRYGRQHHTSYRKNPAFRKVAEAAIGLSVPHLNEHLLDEVDRRVFCLRQGVVLQAQLETVLHRRHDRSLLNAAQQAQDDGAITSQAVVVAKAASAARHQKWSSSCSKTWFPTRPPGTWTWSEPRGLPLQVPPNRADSQDSEEYDVDTPNEVIIHPITSDMKDKIEILSSRFVELAQRFTEVRSVYERTIREREDAASKCIQHWCRGCFFITRPQWLVDSFDVEDYMRYKLSSDDHARHLTWLRKWFRAHNPGSDIANSDEFVDFPFTAEHDFIEALDLRDFVFFLQLSGFLEFHPNALCPRLAGPPLRMQCRLRPDISCRLIIGDVPEHATADVLTCVFSAYGHVCNVVVKPPLAISGPRGGLRTARITYDRSEAPRSAARAFKGVQYKLRDLDPLPLRVLRPKDADCFDPYSSFVSGHALEQAW